MTASRVSAASPRGSAATVFVPTAAEPPAPRMGTDTPRMHHQIFEGVAVAHRAATARLNAKRPWIMYGARGFRNRGAFKVAIPCHGGGCALEPRHAEP